jgi:ubiquinone/menaquinone biosynthesis C-methylase UbiE
MKVITERVPLEREPLDGPGVVVQYDKGARYYMMPEYKYFVHKILRRGIRKGRVLDIGTGSGRLAIELAKVKGTDFKITGLDVSGEMLELAGENARKAGVADRIEFVLGNAADMPFPDGAFDLVISYASLHHWFRPEDVFTESQRVAGQDSVIMIRDNRRIYGNKFWEAFVWVLCRFMNKRHRDNWPGVIRSSYTLPEIADIVRNSGMKDYRIGTDFITFDLYVEARGSRGT